jgi:glutamate dehydrogenase (NADP+)
MHPYTERALATVKQRNPGEPLFHQAVEEVFHSLDPVVAKRPEIEGLNILERIAEPERQAIFRICWQDDKGRMQVNRGFRVGFNSVLGPYKGGLRFHPTVDLGTIKFLAFEQIFKNSLTTLMMGGAKGGSDFNPKGRSDSEVMRFCQSFMVELSRHIGDHTDVPAGDIGVGAREIGYLFGQYKRLVNRYEPGVLTGKDIRWGGSLVRKEATGYGCVYFAQEMLAAHHEALEGKTCVVSGSGNVAIYAIEKLQALGAKVVACSDSDGFIHDSEGLHLETIKAIKEVQRGRIAEYLKERPKSTYQPGGNIWTVPCQAAFPCATQNEISGEDAALMVKNGCQLVAEGANMPTAPEGVHAFQKAGVLFGPGKAANAGGVSVSGLEMQQNASWTRWTFEEVDQKLHHIMKQIHTTCIQHSTEYGQAGDYVLGANVGGFNRLVDVMIAHGLV